MILGEGSPKSFYKQNVQGLRIRKLRGILRSQTVIPLMAGRSVWWRATLTAAFSTNSRYLSIPLSIVNAGTLSRIETHKTSIRLPSFKKTPRSTLRHDFIKGSSKAWRLVPAKSIDILTVLPRHVALGRSTIEYAMCDRPQGVKL